MTRSTTYGTSAVLAGLAGLHVAWGLGSSFPFDSRTDLADAVVGAPSVPPPAACHTVAAGLVAACALVADVPVGSAPLRRFGRVGVASVLAGRGLLGLAGRTDLVSPGSSSSRFRRLDRRLYAPLCLLLGLGAASAVLGDIHTLLEADGSAAAAMKGVASGWFYGVCPEPSTVPRR